MITKLYSIESWIIHRKWKLLLFITSNVCVLGIVSVLKDPTVFFILGTFGVIPFFFIFQVDNFFEGLSLILLLFMIELLYINIGAAALLIGFAVIIWLAVLRSLIDGFDQWKNVILLKQIIFFLTIVFISLFTGAILLNGLRLFVINLLLGAVFFLLTHFTVSNFKNLHYLTFFLILFFFINGIYGIFYYIQTQTRAESFIIDTPTYSGHFFVQGIALAIGAYFTPRFFNQRKFLIIIITVLLIALFLTLTRAAYLAFFFLLILSLAFYRIPKRYVIIGTVMLAVALLFAFLYLRTEALMIMLRNRMSMDIQNANISVGSLAFRILLWQSAWEIFINNPIIGIGFDNFVSLHSSTSLYPIIKGLGGSTLYVHNVYLQIMAEMGIIGLIAFLYLIIAAYINIAKMSRIMKDHNYRFLLLGYGGGFCLWLFMALTEASLYTPITAIFFFFYLGIFSGFHKLLKPEERL